MAVPIEMAAGEVKGKSEEKEEGRFNSIHSLKLEEKLGAFWTAVLIEIAAGKTKRDNGSKRLEKDWQRKSITQLKTHFLLFKKYGNN